MVVGVFDKKGALHVIKLARGLEQTTPYYFFQSYPFQKY